MRTKYVIMTILAFVFGLKCTAQTVSGKKGGHDYVDLGLLSGRLWATCNVGASKPTKYGDYFAWGETKPKEIYTWATYKFESEFYKNHDEGWGVKQGCNKYTVADELNLGTDSVAWYDKEGNFIGDSLTTLQAEDDAASVNWGPGWRMPTKDEIIELIYSCNWEWTEDFNGSGVAGCIGTSKTNGNTIFLPAAGSRADAVCYFAGERGYFWSASLKDYSSTDACYLYLNDVGVDLECSGRHGGQSVRAVVK